MSPESREEQILLSLSLGPVFPLWGVVETTPGVLACECGGRPNCKSGKHPRWTDYRRKATSNPNVIRQWLQQYPYANFGVVTGPVTIALDADVRDDENANGLRTLECLELDEGERLPGTVEVLTGRENGSRHLYFKAPAHAVIRTRSKVLPGLDVRAGGGYCVAAGSRHICGGYYHFAEECRPDEQAVADLPDFVLTALAESSPKTVILGPQKAYIESLAGFDTYTPTDGTTLPDGVVLGVMLRDPVARFYWNGGRRNPSPSEDDFALACKLAFYCRHDLRQMHRLFMRSGLRRAKYEQKRPGGDYALWTLKRAIKATPNVWIRKKRQRPSTATGRKTGRKVSANTLAVLELHRCQPELTAAEIATCLDLRPKQVRDAIYYHGHRSTENTWLLIHSKGFVQETQGNHDLESDNEAA
jgi:hypothetical protein